jgi:uncharacterized protein YcbK (DUF882 family)
MQLTELIKTSDLIPGSKYFTWHEALWLPQMEAYAKPTADEVENIKRQAKELDRIRDYFQKPLIVHCWLRPVNYNKLVGGAKASKHLEGLATDFDVLGLACTDARVALLKDRPYAGRFELNTPTWIHADLGGTKDFTP